MAIFIPFIAAVFIPFIYKSIFHVLILVGSCLLFLLLLFIGLVRYVPSVATGETYINTISWIPSAGINFTTYLDGLSLIFGLLNYRSGKSCHSLLHLLFIE